MLSYDYGLYLLCSCINWGHKPECLIIQILELLGEYVFFVCRDILYVFVKLWMLSFVCLFFCHACDVFRLCSLFVMFVYVCLCCNISWHLSQLVFLFCSLPCSLHDKMATNPSFFYSQDNWDDEDEDEEKKAEIAKTGML